MPRIVKEKAIKGSQKWLQELVNQNTDLLNNVLRPKLRLSANDTITWLSPLVEDGYAEYQDETFLELISIQLIKRSLNTFWPRGGPVWDCLGRSKRGDIILVEAKSHISELSSPCQATSQPFKLIRESLEETATFFGAVSSANWLKDYYQYANRLAHLYLLRHLNGIPTWLIFIYFINDFKMAGPKSVHEWQSAIETVHTNLDINPKKLEPYVINIFYDVKEQAIKER